MNIEIVCNKTVNPIANNDPTAFIEWNNSAKPSIIYLKWWTQYHYFGGLNRETLENTIKNILHLLTLKELIFV